MKVFSFFVLALFILNIQCHRPPVRAFARRPLPNDIEVSTSDILQENLDLNQYKAEGLGKQNAHPEIESENSAEEEESMPTVLKIDLDEDY